MLPEPIAVAFGVALHKPAFARSQNQRAAIFPSLLSVMKLAGINRRDRMAHSYDGIGRKKMQTGIYSLCPWSYNRRLISNLRSRDG